MAMTAEEKLAIDKHFDFLTNQVQESQNEAMRIKNEYGKLVNAPASMEDDELAKLQLDCNQHINRIYHELSRHKFIKLPNGGDDWVEPDDDRLKILSKEGIDFLMNELRIHVSPLTLLSNYDPVMVEKMTCHFGRRIRRLMFNQAEFFFYYPKPEELFERTIKIIQQYPDQFPEFLKDNGDDTYTLLQEELWEKCIEWSYDELRNKFQHHEVIVFSVMELFYSTYRRAVNGEERKRLREKQIFTTSQTIAPQQPQQKRGLFG